jgi:hypothetical protein
MPGLITVLQLDKRVLCRNGEGSRQAVLDALKNLLLGEQSKVKKNTYGMLPFVPEREKYNYCLYFWMETMKEQTEKIIKSLSRKGRTQQEENWKEKHCLNLSLTLWF